MPLLLHAIANHPRRPCAILKIDGALNISEIGIKSQDHATFMRHCAILHTKVFAQA
jgi:hypothetical protein